jgi:glycosyltransferase involved in cell wall biosynthesis
MTEPLQAGRPRPTLTLFMPVLNEITGLQAILPRIRREWCDQILMVDGGSSDGSLEYARQCGCETYVQRRTGIRFAYIEAWPLIRGDIVITLSPDGNCPAEAIPQLTAAMCAGDDMVIASRYLDGLKSEDERKLKVLRWGGSYFLQVFRELYYWS